MVNATNLPNAFWTDAESRFVQAAYKWADHAYGPIPIKDVANEAGISPEEVKPLVDRLIKRGIFNRAGQDKIGFTEQGDMEAHVWFGKPQGPIAIPIRTPAEEEIERIAREAEQHRKAERLLIAFYEAATGQGKKLVNFRGVAETIGISEYDASPIWADFHHAGLIKLVTRGEATTTPEGQKEYKRLKKEQADIRIQAPVSMTESDRIQVLAYMDNLEWNVNALSDAEQDYLLAAYDQRPSGTFAIYEVGEGLGKSNYEVQKIVKRLARLNHLQLESDYDARLTAGGATLSAHIRSRSLGSDSRKGLDMAKKDVQRIDPNRPANNSSGVVRPPTAREPTIVSDPEPVAASNVARTTAPEKERPAKWDHLMGVLESSIKAVPFNKYVKGVLGAVAAVALALFFVRGNIKVAVFGTLIIISLAAFLVLLGGLKQHAATHSKPIIIILMYFFAFAFIAVTGLLISSFFFGVPQLGSQRLFGG